MGQMMGKRSPILVPSYDFDVLEYFGSSFEVVYAILHPFEWVAPEHQDFINDTWAPDEDNPYLGTNLEFLACGEGPTWLHYQTLIHPFPWREISKMMGFPSLNYLNRLLQECCSARIREYGEDIDRMFETMKPLGIDRPSEGFFPPLLLDNFFRSFLDIGETMVQMTSEFGDESATFEVQNLLNQKLTDVCDIFRHKSTLHPEDYRTPGPRGHQWRARRGVSVPALG